MLHFFGRLTFLLKLFMAQSFFLLCFACAPSERSSLPLPYAPLPAKGAVVIARHIIDEPSGICWHSQRRTLFVVSDNGGLYEISTAGKLLKERHFGKRDFEGITHDPVTGLLYVAVEGSALIVEVDPETFDIQREFAIPRQIDGTESVISGRVKVEGITFIPDPAFQQGGLFYVARQSSRVDNSTAASGLILLELPIRDQTGVPHLRGYLAPGVADLSGLHYDLRSEHIFVASDRNDALLEFTREHTLIQLYRLPGVSQEGITADDEGNFYIAQDSGGIVKLRWLQEP